MLRVPALKDQAEMALRAKRPAGLKVKNGLPI
jgi:hypothetical protein